MPFRPVPSRLAPSHLPRIYRPCSPRRVAVVPPREGFGGPKAKLKGENVTGGKLSVPHHSLPSSSTPIASFHPTLLSLRTAAILCYPERILYFAYFAFLNLTVSAKLRLSRFGRVSRCLLSLSRLRLSLRVRTMHA